ncbi:hypothetical protein AW736_01070 [Termitidicoccus mucosus]|uniref:Uncharacterized protein n=1 Tax=Termitidicoccus mucosus TaxID=1184151 RepID=A0A178IMF7_9BACT|nr:hypothetical protein AW736_01070 [Opitutaceae bacterium TSB47]
MAAGQHTNCTAVAAKALAAGKGMPISAISAASIHGVESEAEEFHGTSGGAARRDASPYRG